MPVPAIDKPADIDLNFLRACLKDAGQLALSQRGQQTAMTKADLTPVTEVDRQVEGFLIQRIAQRYPGHQVLSEESGDHPGSEAYTWVIDPIDGTRSFAAGLPIWGVSIGIFRDDLPLAGGLYLPVTGEMYWGTRREAYYNERQLRPIISVDLGNFLNFLAVPSNFHLHFDSSFPRLRSIGSTAAHLAYVAMGAAAGALMSTVSLWDIAGLLPAFAAVGIELANLSGQPFQLADLLDGRPIREPLLAAHPSVIPALRDSIWKK